MKKESSGETKGFIPWPVALIIGIAAIAALLMYGEKIGDPAFSFSAGEKASYSEESSREERVLYQNDFMYFAIEE